MTDIYRDSTGSAAALSISGATVTGAKFVRSGVDIPASPVGSTVPIPYAITYTDGDFDVVWTYTIGVGGVVYTRTDNNRVVTPYFNAAELVEHDADMSTLIPTQVARLERLVRGVVDAYTGQSFGSERGWLVAYGGGDGILHTTKRVETIISLAENDYPNDLFISFYRPIRQGFAIEMIESDYGDSIKVPAYEERLSAYGTTGPRGFVDNVAYRINGVFGYNSVPYDVNLAALHLAEEFSCDETLWRDRYIKSIKGEGFDIEFRSDAFNGTGSVIADQLLGKYVVNKLAII